MTTTRALVKENIIKQEKDKQAIAEESENEKDSLGIESDLEDDEEQKAPSEEKHAVNADELKDGSEELDEVDRAEANRLESTLMDFETAVDLAVAANEPFSLARPTRVARYTVESLNLDDLGAERVDTEDSSVQGD